MERAVSLRRRGGIMKLRKRTFNLGETVYANYGYKLDKFIVVGVKRRGYVLQSVKFPEMALERSRREVIATIQPRPEPRPLTTTRLPKPHAIDPRIDLVLQRDDAIYVISGVPAVAPVRPLVPSGYALIAAITVLPVGRAGRRYIAVPLAANE